MNRQTPFRGALMALLLAVFGAWSPALRAADVSADPTLRLESVDVRAVSGQRLEVQLSLSGPAPAPLAFTVDNPARISLDLPGTTLALPSRRIDVHKAGLDSIVAAESTDRTRVVLNLDRLQPYDTRIEGNRIFLTLGEAPAGAAVAGAVVAATALPRTNTLVPATGGSGIRSLDFRRGTEGSGRIIVRLADPHTPVSVRNQGNQILVDFAGASLPQNYLRRYDVVDFGTPVQGFDAVRANGGTRLVISATGDYEQLAYQSDDQYVIEVQPARSARAQAEAERPVLYVGGGILKARAAEALMELVKTTDFPVVTTLMARGAFPDDHERCLGMPGMHGNYTAITAMQKSDLLIALGSRFDDRVTGKLDGFAPDAKIIHVDIDPAELSKVRRADVPIVGDCRVVIEELVKVVRAEKAKRSFPALGPWHTQLREWQERYPLVFEQLEDGPLKPQFVIDTLRDNTPDDTIVASGVGQHQMWTAQRWKFNHPYTWVNSGGLGTMGFSVPAAIGAKVGKPERMVWAVDGDGCFQMTAQELVTASAERIPVKVAILNNAYLGMVRQWQELFYEERYSEVYLSPDLPDYVKWAEAMGCVAFRVDTP